MSPSSTHLVIIPSYNPGRRLLGTVREALEVWQPVWVIDDGSTDGSLEEIEALARTKPGLKVLRRQENGGKGAAVLSAAERAVAEGFTHGLVLDADGQHPSERIQDFMRFSERSPEHLVAGVPEFGPEAPALRLYGRKLSVFMVWLELGGAKLKDPLFGFRVYPLWPMVTCLHETRWARRYDFDPEVAVRMAWTGVPILNEPASCRYIAKDDGGVSHFHYLRDNVRMVFLHTRLVLELLFVRWWRGR